ncbi:MAG: hypothetical protein ACO1OB_30555 [Archangium sp.]
MRFHKFLAFSTAVISSTLIGACAIPQPPFECNTLSPFWAFYTLESGDPASSCGSKGGDYLNTQRYLPPNGTEARLALLPYAVGINSYFERTDPADPDKKKESAIGRFQTLLPDDRGICTVVDVADTEQNYPPVVDEMGMETDPALSLRYKWEGVRVISTAEFPGTLLDGKVTITEDACTASYKVYAVHPVVFCDPAETTMKDGKPYNVACDPEPDVAAGRITGSGMNAAIEPTCIPVTGDVSAAEFYFEHSITGVCGPSAAKTLDALADGQ